MKKRKPMMKLLTMALAMTLMLAMSGMTAFATENKTDGQNNAETTCTAASAEECTTENCPVHKADAQTDAQADENKQTKTDAQADADKQTGADDQSGEGMKTENSAKKTDESGDQDENSEEKAKDAAGDTKTGQDKDKGSETDAQKTDKDKGSDDKNVDKDKGDSVSSNNMTASEVKDNTNVAKTGEVDIVPVIIALAVIAVGAGAAFVVYKKKR